MTLKQLNLVCDFSQIAIIFSQYEFQTGPDGTVMEKVVEAVNAGVDKGVRALGAAIDDLQYGQPQEAQLGPQLLDR